MSVEEYAFQAVLQNRKEGKVAKKREQDVPKNSHFSPYLEPVKHLSSRLQQKLVKREYRQRKRFRSSGKPYPLVMDMDMHGNEEKRFVPAWASTFTKGQRLALAIASLVMLLTFGLGGIAAATHEALGVGFLILFVVALFTSATVILTIVFNRKP